MWGKYYSYYSLCVVQVEERCTGTGASTPSPTREDPAPAPLSFWNFTDAQGNTRSVFNSLPRSFYQSLPRRGRLHSLSADKRNSDSTLLQRTSFPPPTCSPSIHANGFHEVQDHLCRHMNSVFWLSLLCGRDDYLLVIYRNAFCHDISTLKW